MLLVYPAKRYQMRSFGLIRAERPGDDFCPTGRLPTCPAIQRVHRPQAHLPAQIMPVSPPDRHTPLTLAMDRRQVRAEIRQAPYGSSSLAGAVVPAPTTVQTIHRIGLRRQPLCTMRAALTCWRSPYVAAGPTAAVRLRHLDFCLYARPGHSLHDSANAGDTSPRS